MNSIPETFRIALVIPPTGNFRRDERCQSAVESQTAVVILPPIDMARYASIIRQYKHIPRIFDFQLDSGNDGMFQKLLDFKPHLMLISISTPTEKEDLAFINMVKSSVPVRVLVKGGVSPWEPASLLERAPAVDYVFTGEVEKSLEQFLDRGGQPDSTIPAFAYRIKNAVEINSGSSREREISRFPLPARDLLENEKYLNPATRQPMTVIHAHRGCPGSCIFCPAPLVEGKKVRFRSIDDVISEITQCVNQFNIRQYLFDGDTFTINKNWVLDLCRALQESGLDIQWACNSRVDTLDEEMAIEMKNAGCWIIGFGIESGSKEMLEKMKKNTTTEQAFKAVRICQKYGIKVHTFYIIGLPWETKESLQQTLYFAKKLKADFFDVNLASPLPGTPFYNIVNENNLYTCNEGAQLSYADSAICSFALDNKTLKKWRRKILLSLTLSPHFIIKSLRFAWKQGQVPYYITYAVKRMKNIMRTA